MEAGVEAGVAASVHALARAGRTRLHRLWRYTDHGWPLTTFSFLLSHYIKSNDSEQSVLNSPTNFQLPAGAAVRRISSHGNGWC